MATSWSEAPTEVIRIALDLINQYHPELRDAKIGFVFQDPAPTSGGREVLGKAMKTTAVMRVFMDYDFIIILSQEEYIKLSAERRTALIDHQLCHLVYDEGDCSLRGHDVEEFHTVIQRHGLWNADLVRFSNDDLDHCAHQLNLFDEAVKKSGKVESVDVSLMRDGQTVWEHHVETQPAEVS